MLRAGWQRVQRALLRLHERPFSSTSRIVPPKTVVTPPSASSSALPTFADRGPRRKEDGGNGSGSARRLSLLLEQMSRRGVREAQTPAVAELLQALMKHAANLHPVVICEIFSSMRHLRCRVQVHRNLSNALAERLLDRLNFMQLRKIPTLMGDLVRLNMETHPVFEELRQLVLLRCDPAALPGSALARIAWALSRAQRLTTADATVLDRALSEAKLNLMQPRELAMTASAFGRSQMSHKRLYANISTCMGDEHIINQATPLTICNILKALVRTHNTDRTVFTVVAQHLQNKPEVLEFFNAEDLALISGAFAAVAPDLLPIGAFTNAADAMFMRLSSKDLAKLCWSFSHYLGAINKAAFSFVSRVLDSGRYQSLRGKDSAMLMVAIDRLDLPLPQAHILDAVPSYEAFEFWQVFDICAVKDPEMFKKLLPSATSMLSRSDHDGSPTGILSLARLVVLKNVYDNENEMSGFRKFMQKNVDDLNTHDTALALSTLARLLRRHENPIDFTLVHTLMGKAQLDIGRFSNLDITLLLNAISIMTSYANEVQLSRLWKSLRDHVVSVQPPLLLSHVCSILKSVALAQRHDDVFVDLLCDRATFLLDTRVDGVVRSSEVIQVVHLISAYTATAQLGFFKNQFQERVLEVFSSKLPQLKPKCIGSMLWSISRLNDRLPCSKNLLLAAARRLCLLPPHVISLCTVAQVLCRYDVFQEEKSAGSSEEVQVWHQLWKHFSMIQIGDFGVLQKNILHDVFMLYCFRVGDLSWLADDEDSTALLRATSLLQHCTAASMGSDLPTRLNALALIREVTVPLRELFGDTLVVRHLCANSGYFLDLALPSLRVYFGVGECNDAGVVALSAAVRRLVLQSSGWTVVEIKESDLDDLKEAAKSEETFSKFIVKHSLDPPARKVSE